MGGGEIVAVTKRVLRFAKDDNLLVVGEGERCGRTESGPPLCEV